ncbi:hypothetical protein G7Y89_g5016 [Cudoniella acicularis]|uniref:Bud22 domain-containing protein n=1 Tax=Cudoniella acicularis TaxID=354080 RepID=A0A8H4W6V9_9HELO|nr:hypothetical protein G7Y89_g5016 [Cudoniella acicularis]
MPKRKRPDYGNPTARLKQDVLEKIQHSQKLLHRALKTAKGFERQKLGKRLKAAQAKGSDGAAEVGRINKEIEALKGLDLGNMAESYLATKIMKVKRMSESEVLPEEVKMMGEKKVNMSEELGNVMSGMYNLKVVKDLVGEILRGLYLVMGIPLPLENGKDKKAKSSVAGNTPKSIGREDREEIKQDDSINTPELEWDGFESDDERPRSKQEEQDSDLDSEDEDFSRYDALLGSSDSDSESNSESGSVSPPPRARNPQPQQELSLSPSPPPASKKPRTTTQKKPPHQPPKSTTFLPTLMGGYFSGSDSSASDIEDLPSNTPLIRKNRPGQMARRAIAEKKFGTGANHIKKGLPRVAEMGKAGKGKGGKDDGWDGKRGAKETGRERGRGRGSGGFGDRGFKGTGDNAIPTGKRGMGKKDDVGVLHPSWQAAKKVKEEKQTAKFAGKKVVFD